MFSGLWRIIKDTGQPFHRSLSGFGIGEYPWTINTVVKRRQLIDSFMELPKEKRPPRSIWNKPRELDEWFDRVYSHGEKQTEFNLNVSEDEIE